MEAGLRDLRRIQIGQQTYGYWTPVTPTDQLVGMIDAVEDRNRQFVEEASGVMASHRRTYDQSVIANLAYDAATEGATFEQLIIFLSMAIMGGVTPANLGSGAYRWDFDPDEDDPDPPDIYTLRLGDNNYCWVTDSVFARALTLGAVTQAGWDLTADLVGDQLDPSSFQAGITYPTTLETILAQMTRLYIDDTAAGLGVTPFDGTLIDWELGIPGYHEKFFQDGQMLFGGVGLASRAVAVRMTLEFNGLAIAEWLDWRASTPRFIRLQALGSTIGGGIRNTAQIDLRVVWDTHAALGERDGNDIMEFTGRTVFGPTWQRQMRFQITNAIDGLPS